MPGTYADNRQAIIEYANTLLNTDSDAFIVDEIIDYCRTNAIPLTDRDILDLISQLSRDYTEDNSGGVSSAHTAMLAPGTGDSDPELLTGTGAVSLDMYQTHTNLQDGGPLTLADGTEVGQVKSIFYIGGDSFELEVATLNAPYYASPNGDGIYFTQLGDYLLLQWVSTGWRVLERMNLQYGEDGPSNTAPS